MKASFLEYYKLILRKVSFDNRLSLKEYKKAKRHLSNDEYLELSNWFRNYRLLQIRK